MDQVLAQENVSDPSVAGVLWMLADNQGTVRDLVDGATGGFVAHNTYDAFGTPVGSAMINNLTRYLYTGREFDAATGLDYNRNRWYDPHDGRFVSQDPISFAGGDANLYRYVDNSPTNGTDPSGFIFETIVDIGGIGYDAYSFWNEPSWGNAGYLGWSVAAAAIPIVPGSYKGRAAKFGSRALGKADDVAEAATKTLRNLTRDATGKVHGALPNHVPKSCTREELSDAARELAGSIGNRKREQRVLGEHGPHRERIRQEEDLLRQIQKVLSGS